MLPIIFAVLLAFIVIMYVILDGFDLGVGILFMVSASEKERDAMMNSIAPIWDGNETWLVFGGAMLYGAFPLVYGLVLPILYMPLMLMVIALIFRGVSFEFRFKADTSKALWNWVFAISSILATFFQGVVLGNFVEGFSVSGSTMMLEPKPWLTPFSLLTAIALVCGYGLLGSTWLIIKCENILQKKMIHVAKGLLILVSIFLVIVSIWTPLQSQEIYHRWYDFPNIIFLSVLPIATILFIVLAWSGLNKGSEKKPFIYSILIFFCAYIGIAISVYPYLIPRQLTLWETAAPDSTLRFILVGVVLMLPTLLIYTFFSYRVFKGKSQDIHY